MVFFIVSKWFHNEERHYKLKGRTLNSESGRTWFKSYLRHLLAVWPGTVPARLQLPHLLRFLRTLKFWSYKWINSIQTHSFYTCCIRQLCLMHDYHSGHLWIPGAQTFCLQDKYWFLFCYMLKSVFKLFLFPYKGIPFLNIVGSGTWHQNILKIIEGVYDYQWWNSLAQACISP